MSALTLSRLAARRPATITISILLLVLLSVSVLLPIPGFESIPRAALIIGYLFAALKLVAAFGLWRCRKWAAILGFIAVLLDALLAVPGMFESTAALQLYTITGVSISIIVLVLLLLPVSRHAYV